MKTTTLFLSAIIIATLNTSCGSNKTTDEVASIDTLSEPNLDSLNQLYRQDPDSFKSAYLNKPITLIGTMDQDGEFTIPPKVIEDNWGAKTTTWFSAHTNLTRQDFEKVDAIPQQSRIATFYNASTRQFLASESEAQSLILSIHLDLQAPQGSQYELGVNRSLTVDEQAAMKQRSLAKNVDELKQKFPDLHAALLSKHIHVCDSAGSILDQLVIDQVTVRGTMVDVDTNRGNGLRFALKDVRILDRKRVFEPSTLPVLDVYKNGPLIPIDSLQQPTQNTEQDPHD